MKRLLVIVVGVLLLSCTTDAQGSGSAVGSGSGVIITTPCLDAGFTSCCPGRDDACHPGDNRTRASCYCDAFCLQTASDDCCDDLTMGLLLCSKFKPDLACIIYHVIIIYMRSLLVLWYILVGLA